MAVVHKLIPSDNRWKFTRKMKREFENNPAGRIWWVNTNTKIKTNIADQCTEITDPPPGLHVFPMDPPESPVVDELRSLYQQEITKPTLPFYNMAPYNKLHILFTSKNPEDTQMTFLQVMGVLHSRAPETALLVEKLCDSVQSWMQISREVLEADSNLGVIKYEPGAGFQTHVDNIVRSSNSVGPVFTLSLGPQGLKYMDMFPVIEHKKYSPVRITTPIGSVILMDGVSRLEWSHGIPEGDMTERWTIMLKFRQISNSRVKYSKILNMPIYESILKLPPEFSNDTASTGDRTEVEYTLV